MLFQNVFLDRQVESLAPHHSIENCQQHQGTIECDKYDENAVYYAQHAYPLLEFVWKVIFPEYFKIERDA